NRISSFGFSKETNNSINRFYNVSDFSPNIGKDHHIAGKVNAFLVHLLSVAYLHHLFSRYQYLVNKVFKAFMSDLALYVLLYFIFLPANGANNIPFFIFHLCSHGHIFYDLIHSKYCSITPLNTVSIPQIAREKRI